MKTSIGFAPGHSLHREDMAQAGIKYGRGYCVAGGQNKVSCKNTSYTPGISMHRFPKDESLRRLWTQFVRCHRMKFVPSVYSALCFAHFEPTCFERKLPLGPEAADKTPRNLLKRGSMPTVDTVEPATGNKRSSMEHDKRGEQKESVQHARSVLSQEKAIHILPVNRTSVCRFNSVTVRFDYSNSVIRDFPLLSLFSVIHLHMNQSMAGT